jgi:iron complex outermembrane receptor protein
MIDATDDSRRFERWSTGLVIGFAVGTPLHVAQAQDRGALEEITVTAQKRVENVQDVPISIAAVTGEKIATSHTLNLEALSGLVPNVQIGRFANNPTSAVFNIRGMGAIEPDPYAGSAVTVVIDGVPQVFNMISLPNMFDIERVEILRGPQGTLFGANTTGGVVNIVTKQPTGETGGSASVSIGNYDRVDANASFDFPIIEDVLAGKIAVIHHTQDGWHTNIVDRTSMGDQSVTALRGALKWTASDTVDVTLIAEIDEGRNGSPIVVQGGTFGDPALGIPGDIQYLNAPPGTQPPGNELPQYESPCVPAGTMCKAPDKYYAANNSVPDRDYNDIYAGTLTVNWDSPFGEIVSITGYKEFTQDNWTDQDGTLLFQDDTHRVTEGSQFTQEIRDTFDVSDTFRMTVGGFFSYDEYEHSQNFRIEFAAPGFRQLSTQDQERTSYSLFAQGYWDLTSNLTLQAGIRGTIEETKMVSTIDNFVNFIFDEDGNIIGAAPGIFTGDTPVGGFVAAPPEESWENVGGKLGLDYRLSDDLMVYGYVARGFKSGGFTGRISLPSSIGPYDPEYVTTFELGMKADWLDNRLRTNLAVFFNQYDDLQLSQIIFVEVDGVLVNDNTILNAANAETYGLELEIEAAPTENLRLNASVAYLNAEYTEFDYLQPDGSTLDLTGERLQNAPEVTASAGFTFSIPAGRGLFELGVQDRYTDSKFNTSLLNTARSKIQATNYVDANIDWYPDANGSLSFSIWGRNLADERYIAAVFDAPGTLGLVNYEPPRQYGFTVRYDW